MQRTLAEQITVGCPDCGETGKVDPQLLVISLLGDKHVISNLPICTRCGETMQPLPEDAASLFFFGIIAKN